MFRGEASSASGAFFASRALGAIAALFLVSGTIPAKSSDRSDLRRWLEGPVRYLIDDDEHRVYRALQSDEERTRFIDRFWARRDPTPETDENEYRALFWTRVKFANERYSDSAIPGWKSDRGKMFVLCGEPSRVEDDSRVDTNSGRTAGRGLIRWVYEGRPCGRSDLGPVVIVPFVRASTGEYRLSYDPKLSSLYWNPYALRDELAQSVARWLDFIAPPDRSPLAVMADLGKLQDAPHPEQVIIERVETSESYGSHPLTVEVNRYRHPRGGALLVLTVAAPEGKSHKPPTFITRFAPRDPARTKRFLTEESFRLEGAGPDRVAQARLIVDPGVWDVTLLSSEPDATTNGIHQVKVEVPLPVDGIALSDVVLAQALEPAAYAALATHDEPYRVGAFRVVPRPAHVVRRGEPVTVFFEVYGAPGTFHVDYRVEGREDDGRFTALGRPFVNEEAQGAQGWSVPTSESWPTGAYRVRIHVRDPAGASVDAVVPFELE